ncbi:MAG: DegV family protein [Chloroflexi bacterium]|nr:DegV family protein [Chloroflexota bacterium]
MIKIVTDSLCDLPDELLAQHEIVMVPVYVIFSDGALRDRLDITNAELHERLDPEDLPTTSQPSVADFQRVYQRILEDDPKATILSIHIGVSFSGTLESAKAAAASLPEADIHLFDTRSLTLGQGLLVLKAAEMAKKGASLEAILKTLEDMRDNSSFLFAAETLIYLQAGGRIGRVARFLGTLLDMKPIIGLKDGAFEPIDRQRSFARAIRAIEEKTLAALEDRQGIELGVVHANNPVVAQQLADRLKSDLNPDRMIVFDVCPALVINAGPGTIGVIWYAPPLEKAKTPAEDKEKSVST